MRRPVLILGSVLLLLAGMGHPADAAPDEAPGPRAGAGTLAVDIDAVSRQNERLEALLAGHRAGSGGTYFDEATGQLVVRYVDNADGASLKARLDATARHAGDVGIRFERTTTSIDSLRAAARKLDDSRDWAGPHAGRVHQVTLDELRAQLVIHASGEAGQLTAAATRATGFTPRVSVTATGIVQQISRRNDVSLYNGGMALWSGSDGSGSDSAFCTTGFRMTRGGTNSNWMTTAGHCGPNGRIFWHNGRAVARVSSNYEPLGTDVAMLAPWVDGEAFSRYIWFGPTNTSTKRGVTGKNTTWPAVGSAVYVSGANGGLVHGLVTSTTETCAGMRMVQVDTRTGHANDGATLGGDSGAPVVRWNTATSDTTDVVAVGSHACGDGYTTSYFVPIHQVEAATDATVVVGGN
ncbi:hypothetical protein ABZ793_25515 [Micromonospora sp. NPDC047465]|uniref:hypothetical protein n=1 Tax=Micromonospora sp. NPDC047465 TaxID=3154813 RepID=UPI0033E45A53